LHLFDQDASSDLSGDAVDSWLDSLRYDDGDVSSGACVVLHDVSPYDTLPGISVLYDVEVAAIKQCNRLWQSDIGVRTVLRVPVGGTRADFERRTRARANAIVAERAALNAAARNVAAIVGVINVAALIPYVRRTGGDEAAAVALYERENLPASKRRGSQTSGAGTDDSETVDLPAAAPAAPAAAPAPARKQRPLISFDDDDDDDSSTHADLDRDDKAAEVRKLSTRSKKRLQKVDKLEEKLFEL
jgi:hypothetical protein